MMILTGLSELRRRSGLRIIALAGGLAISQLACGWTSQQVFDTGSLGGLRIETTLQVATNGIGTWEAVWCSNAPLGVNFGVMHSRSTDSGLTWSAPEVINTNTSATASFENSPAVAGGNGGTWVVVWDSEDAAAGIGGGEKDILFCRSTDNGVNWSATGALNSDAATNHYRNFSPAVATDGAGVWVCAWETYDSTSGTLGVDCDIRFARSTDNGATWSPVANLNTDALGDARGDTSVRLATDRAGHWVAVWEGRIGNMDGSQGDPEIYCAVSSDNGSSWSAPKTLNVNAPTDTGSDFCPRIACDGAGNWVAVWVSNDTLGGTIDPFDDILFARSTDNGMTWSAPAALKYSPDAGTRVDMDPMITFGGGFLSVVWSSLDGLGGSYGTDPDIVSAFSSDGGANWSTPVFVNTNAASDGIRDQAPQSLIDPSGKQVVIWTTGAYPSAGDMLYSTGALSAAARDWMLY